MATEFYLKYDFKKAYSRIEGDSKLTGDRNNNAKGLTGRRE